MEQNNTFENVSLDVNILLEMKGYLFADFSQDLEKKEIYKNCVSAPLYL